MKNFNALSEEDLNKASGGTILHDKETGEYMVGSARRNKDYEADNSYGPNAIEWQTVAKTNSLENAQRIAETFDLDSNVIDI